MFEAARYIPENDAIDWHALADQLFPADALLTAPTFTQLTVFGTSA
jgi:hypothetical protein